MARTNEQLTASEINEFQKFCNENRIVSDETEAGQANGTLIGEYIAIAWKEDITPQTLEVALDKLRDRIVFYTPAQFEYKKIADEDTARANALNAWFHSPSNTSLVKDGEQAFQNQSVLLTELRGREITSQNIQDAIGRAGYKRGLHYATDRIPRPVNPRQHTDDGKGMFSKSDTNLSARDHARLAKEAADKNAGRKTPVAGTDFQALADAVQGRTHSQTANIQRMFVNGPDGKTNWEATLAGRRRVAGL